MPLGSICEPGLLKAHRSPSFRYWPPEDFSLAATEVSSRSRIPLNLLGVGTIDDAPGEVDNAAVGMLWYVELDVGDRVLIDEAPNCELTLSALLRSVSEVYPVVPFCTGA